MNGVKIVCRVAWNSAENGVETESNLCLARTAPRMRPLRLARPLPLRCAPLQAPPLVRRHQVLILHLLEDHKISMTEKTRSRRLRTLATEQHSDGWEPKRWSSDDGTSTLLISSSDPLIQTHKSRAIREM